MILYQPVLAFVYRCLILAKSKNLPDIPTARFLFLKTLHPPFKLPQVLMDYVTLMTSPYKWFDFRYRVHFCRS